MPDIVVATLVRNEADRFWRSALEAWSTFADRIVVLDDGSTDDTAQIADDAGALVRQRGAGVSAWGQEAPARAELWEHALAESDEDDYIFVLDADMTPLRDPRPLLSTRPEGVAFNLYDLWTPHAYRADGFWQAHLHPRLWMVRRPSEDIEWFWSERGIHTGHFPLNLQVTPLIAPPAFGLLHYAYATPQLRAAKHAEYIRVAKQLSDTEMLHAASIMEPATLRPLIHTPHLSLRMPSNAEAADRINHERTTGDSGATPSHDQLADPA
jgi:hypothetical protein